MHWRPSKTCPNCLLFSSGSAINQAILFPFQNHVSTKFPAFAFFLHSSWGLTNSWDFQQSICTPVKPKPLTNACYCLAPPPCFHTHYNSDTWLLKYAVFSAFQDNCLGRGFCPKVSFLKPSQNFLIFIQCCPFSEVRNLSYLLHLPWQRVCQIVLFCSP